MRDVTSSNFGLLIAYVIPGFVTLWGLSAVSDTIRAWLLGGSGDLPTVGGFLYITIASVGAGLTVSTIRWLVIDWIHHRTGIHQPDWDFSRLHETVAAFDVLIEIHYRYYQAYANLIVAVATATAIRSFAEGWKPGELALAILLCWLFFLGSRDTLKKYYRRVEGVLRRRRK